MKILLNGRLVAYEEAVIPVEDRGNLFADAIYEGILAEYGTLIDGPWHYERLRNSASALGIPMPDGIEAGIEELLAAEGRHIASGLVYLQVSRGVGPRSHGIPHGLIPQWFATVRALPKSENLMTGIHVYPVSDERWAQPWIKTVNLLPNMLAKDRAARNGADDAIFVRDGFALESTKANLFVVRDGAIYTAPLSNYLLPGVTRRRILDIAPKVGIGAVERSIPEEWLYTSDEVFLTSSADKVVPVTKVAGREVSAGSGATTKRLYEAYQEFCQGVKR